MKYITSDSHFGHTNIIRFCDRPFDDAHEMNEFILDQWQSKLKPQDELYHLGDVAYKWQKECSYIPERIKKIKCKKILILGNHDHDKAILDCFDEIYQYLEIEFNKRKFVLFHYPISSWNGKNHSSIHLYGHIHSIDAKIHNNAWDVGWDNLKDIIDIEEIYERIRTSG